MTPADPSGALPFVDAHVHFWDPAGLSYPWLTPPFDDSGPNGNVAAIATRYLPADYRADMARWNLAGAVHVEAGAAPGHALDETCWLGERAAADGLPDAIVAHAPLDGADIADRLERQAAHPLVRGIRQIVNWHRDPRRTYTPRDVTHDPAWHAGFALLARHGLSFDLQCYPAQMPDLARLIARTGDVAVIVNHLGMPVLSDPDGLAEWRAGMRALAAIPAVSVKLSGFGFVDRAWTADVIRPFVLELIDLFGTRRCLFASDAPTDKLFAAIDRQMAFCHATVADFSIDERRDLFGHNAARVYRLALTHPEIVHG